jgi:hypothetical protein
MDPRHMTTSDDTIQAWGDPATELTPGQIAELERLEHEEPTMRLEMARQWTADNATLATPFGHAAMPTGAVRTYAGQLDGNWFGYFEGSTRRAGPARAEFTPTASNCPVAEERRGQACHHTTHR